MNRLDLFVNDREISRLCQALVKAGAVGYSVVRHVTGRGVAGEVSESMDFSGLGANAQVIVFCDDTVLAAARLAVKPLLQRFGGVAFVSRAEVF
ncbi:MAG: P-II family nitrogen regulator [Prochlorococcaceae cyanobacterium]|jgi:nitrogen regulatory protein PII